MLRSKSGGGWEALWPPYRAKAHSPFTGTRTDRGVMTKCFFYLKDGSNCFVESLGLRYFDTESAVVSAVAIARVLQAGRAAPAFVVVATDQRGNEIARAPIGRVGEHSTNGRSAHAEPEQYAGRKVARVA